ncbi:MAG: tripartite tricarboxylate transporter TctB family protein [Gammaproteobacteria bacterium]|nr:tripartite tricarboxylate transporter TctB family protein [Gammaproteobacteria bacterium]
MNPVLGRRFVVALTVALLAGLIFRVSYFQDNSEAYLFPSIVATVMLTLSLVSLAREAFDMCVDDFQAFPLLRQLPVILMMVVAVSLVEVLGMYTSAFLVLAVVTYWYSPQTDGRRRLLSCVAFAAGFTAFMYLLFSVMLNVQLPRGVLI